MIEVQNLIDQRKEDIENVMQLLEINESSIRYATLIKSNVFIMLYNLIEGVVTQTYTCLFETVRNDVDAFDNLNDKIKLMYLNLQVGKLDKPENILDYLSKCQDIHKISYDDYIKKRHYILEILMLKQ